ncbi:MAG: tyrosine--tRNA ligase [Candidatus Bipolaricaulia bacterium]
MPESEIETSLARVKRGTVDLIPEAELIGKLKRSRETGEPLRVKLGIDPSAPNLTLGHSVVLRKLRDFQEFGHTAVLVVGDFTRRIGDPSGQTQAREMVTTEEIERNMKDYRDQAFKILDPERTEFRYNSEWLSHLSFEELIILSSKYTVARMLERDDFSKRYRENRPISIMEFLYPLAQAYDSIAIEADVELGGLDQKFNLLIGREIQRQYDQEPQIVVTVPLLIGLDGVRVMSQSKGNYIGINELPNEMYGKVMSIPDSLLKQYYELLIDVPWAEVADLHPKAQKDRLARELVTIYHSQEAAEAAAREFERVFVTKKTPSDIKQVSIDSKYIKEDGTIWIVDLLEGSGLVGSRSQARRLIEQGGVYLNGDRIETVDFDPMFEDGMILQVGKRSFVKIISQGSD